MNTPTDLILASASPRRVELLKQLGITPTAIIPADCDETPHKNEHPAIYVARVARAKAQTIAAREKGKLILAADTTVALGRRILAKAEDETQARHFLTLLSGRRHRVITSVVLVTPEGKLRQKTVTSIIKFAPLTAAMIDDYIASNEWQGKAGAYGIQGRAAAFVAFLSGSHSNVVGLPLYETALLLRAR